MKPYNPIAIANYFIKLSDFGKKKKLTPLKIQKLVFFSYGWYLALTTDNIPLMDEAVEAWPYGPVIPSVYHAFKNFGNDQITALGESIDFEDGEVEVTKPEIDPDDTEVTLLLNKIWDVYGYIDPITLSNMTHAENTAWTKTTNLAKKDNKLIRNLHIDDQLIKDEFMEKAS